MAGRRKGLAGERSGLFFEFVRLLKLFTPGLFLLENVPGLFSSNGGRDFLVVLQHLAQLGYGISWAVLDTQYFGLAQRRERVFIVGSLGNGRSAQILFEPESVRGDSPPSREEGERPTGTLGARTTAGGGFGTDFECAGGVVGCLDARNNVDRGDWNQHSKLVPTVTSKWAKGSGGPSGDECQNLVPAYSLDLENLGGGGNIGYREEATITLNTSGNTGVVHTLSAEGADASEDGTGRGTPLITMPTLRAGCPNDSAGHGARSGDSKDEYIVPVAFQSRASAHQSMNPSPVSPALDVSKSGGTAVSFAENQRAEVLESDCVRQLTTGGGKPGQGYPAMRQGTAVRRLTPKECERLQGFPDDWTRYDAEGKELSDSARYRMLGNAVSVTVSHWIAQRILQFT